MVMDPSPCIAGADRDPDRRDGQTWKDGALWVNLQTRRVFKLVGGAKLATWADITEVAGDGNVYLVRLLASEPVAALRSMIDTWV